MSFALFCVLNATASELVFLRGDTAGMTECCREDLAALLPPEVVLSQVMTLACACLTCLFVMFAATHSFQ